VSVAVEHTGGVQLDPSPHATRPQAFFNGVEGAPSPSSSTASLLSLVCSGMAVLPMLGGGEGGRGREPQGEQYAVSGVWRGGAREGEGERARGRGRAGEGCADAAGETVARRCGLARAESSRCTRRRVGELGSWPPFCAATPYSGPGPAKCGVEELASDRGHTFCRPPKRLPGAEGPPEGKKG